MRKKKNSIKSPNGLVTSLEGKAVLPSFYKYFENCNRSSSCKIKSSTDKIACKLYIYTETRAKNFTKLTVRTEISI